MSEAVVFQFKNFQTVHIKAINADGFVISRIANCEGQNEYKVKFWIEGERKDDWFYEFELKEQP